MNKPYVFAVCGYKNAGKTTLSVKLIKRLTEMGYRVASIKHDGHDFEADVVGTDSYRHRQAGASTSIVFSQSKMMMVSEPLKIEKMLELCQSYDFVLLEGFKKSSFPKIEIVRSFSEPSCVDSSTRLALVNDIGLTGEGIFDLNDVTSLVELLLEERNKRIEE